MEIQKEVKTLVLCPTLAPILSLSLIFSLSLVKQQVWTCWFLMALQPLYPGLLSFPLNDNNNSGQCFVLNMWMSEKGRCFWEVEGCQSQ